MQQVLHLLIVDRARRTALAARYGSRWLLPVVTCAERARAAPLAARWCAEHGLAVEVAGQWLGRVAPDSTDWLIVAVAGADCSVPGSTLEWMPLAALSTGVSLVGYQQWAVVRTLQRDRLPSVSGPFGNLAWPDRVRRWIGRAAGAAASSSTPYRVSPHEVVLGVDCPGGRVYFKGLGPDRAAEARLTQALAAVAPDSFARTVALEPCPNGSAWWLTAACPGRPGRRLHGAAHELARIQQRVAVPRHGSLALQTLNLEAAARWACGLLDDEPTGAVVRRACANAARADHPATWIPMDIDPANILVDVDGQVRFIDVDDSFLGSAPLAMATLAHRCADRTLYRTYELSWSPALRNVDWPSFEIAAIVAAASLGWQRLDRNIARGEVNAGRDLAAGRTRQRLARAIAGISPRQARRGGPAV